ncbi:MAG TPA: RDD family protein [Steroidobacteraceae bacterium]
MRDSEQLRVTGLTGVELSLPIAGPGTRSYAFVIDWHIRVLVALSWLLLARLSLMGFGLVGAGHGYRGAFALLGALPALLLYLLYHPVLELLMHGRTPGKRIAGVRLVTQRGGLPGAGAILMRNVFRLLDAMPFAYLVGLTSCMINAQHLRIGDMAAGTVLVLDTSPSAHSLARLPALVDHSKLDPNVIELLSELLERWPALAVEHRDALARALLARADPAAAPALDAASDTELHARLRAVLPAAA